MLILQRRVGESIHVGNDVIITVNAVRKGGVRLSIQAPVEVRVDRHEVRRRILGKQRGQDSLQTSRPQKES